LAKTCSSARPLSRIATAAFAGEQARGSAPPAVLLVPHGDRGLRRCPMIWAPPGSRRGASAGRRHPTAAGIPSTDEQAPASPATLMAHAARLPTRFPRHRTRAFARQMVARTGAHRRARCLLSAHAIRTLGLPLRRRASGLLTGLSGGAGTRMAGSRRAAAGRPKQVPQARVCDYSSPVAFRAAAWS
jgi:hypothetical protein